MSARLTGMGAEQPFDREVLNVRYGSYADIGSASYGKSAQGAATELGFKSSQELRVTNLKLPAVIATYVEAFNEGDFGKLLGLFTPNAVIFGVLGSAPIAQAEPVWRELHEGMAMHLEPVAVAVDGMTVAVRYIESGRFQVIFRGLSGIAPTAREYQVVAMEWFELEDELIARRWGARDFDSIKAQVLGNS